MRETTEDRHQPMKKQLILLVKNIQPHATFSNNQRLKFSSATIWQINNKLFLISKDRYSCGQECHYCQKQNPPISRLLPLRLIFTTSPKDHINLK
jgi:hypothetical protein